MTLASRREAAPRHYICMIFRMSYPTAHGRSTLLGVSPNDFAVDENPEVLNDLILLPKISRFPLSKLHRAKSPAQSVSDFFVGPSMTAKLTRYFLACEAEDRKMLIISP